MSILIKNCNLISMDQNRKEYEENMDIEIENDEIIRIDKNITPQKETKVINADGKVCMPGFINTHTHLGMSIFRETLDGYTLQDWLSKKIWPMEEKLTGEDIYYATLLSCVEMISTGTTTANDQYFMADNTIRAGIETGVRIEVTRPIMDMGGAGTRLEELEELIKKYNHKYDNITLNVGIHGLYTTSAETVEKAIDLAKKYNVNVHMHFCENSQEVEDIKKAYGVKSPVEVLNKYFSETKNILAHAVKVSDEEITSLNKLDISVSHCPVSNLRLGCGVAKVTKMMEEGINVSLGTDGQRKRFFFRYV